MTDLPDLSGQSLAKYELKRRIARGSMGDVYLGLDPDLRRKVAVKVLTPERMDGPASVSRFKREARILAALSHPNIVQVHTLGKFKETVFLVMEHVDGKTLKDRITEGPTPWQEALRHIHSVASALNVAHRAHVVHRDLKPENIMLTSDGVVKILDFGLAKREKGDRPLTAAGMFLGTPAYASPEQCNGLELDGRSDIFCLGIVAYELLTGQGPIFGGESAAECSDKIRHHAPPALDSLGMSIPSNLARLVEGLLLKDPEDRYPTCGSLLQAIDQVHLGKMPGGPATERRATVIMAPTPDARARELAYEAQSLFNNTEYTGAAELLKEAVQLAPREVIYRRDLGMVYFRQRRYADADRVWRRALRFAPNDLQLHAFRARIPRNFFVTCECGEKMLITPDMIGAIGRCKKCGENLPVSEENVEPVQS